MVQLTDPGFEHFCPFYVSIPFLFLFFTPSSSATVCLQALLDSYMTLLQCYSAAAACARYYRPTCNRIVSCRSERRGKSCCKSILMCANRTIFGLLTAYLFAVYPEAATVQIFPSFRFEPVDEFWGGSVTLTSSYDLDWTGPVGREWLLACGGAATTTCNSENVGRTLFCVAVVPYIPFTSRLGCRVSLTSRHWRSLQHA